MYCNVLGMGEWSALRNLRNLPGVLTAGLFKSIRGCVADVPAWGVMRASPLTSALSRRSDAKFRATTPHTAGRFSHTKSGRSKLAWRRRHHQRCAPFFVTCRTASRNSCTSTDNLVAYSHVGESLSRWATMLCGASVHHVKR